MSLNGKCAVVTGAGTGIGAAIAAKLANMGASVVLCGRNQSSLDAVAEKIVHSGGKAEAFVCDVTHLDSVKALAKFVEQNSAELKSSSTTPAWAAFRARFMNCPPIPGMT